jgi:hypothetical protein
MNKTQADYSQRVIRPLTRFGIAQYILSVLSLVLSIWIAGAIVSAMGSVVNAAPPLSPESVQPGKWCWMEMTSDPTAIFSVPDIPRPGYLEQIVDPVFKTKITRITGDPGTPIITKDGQQIGIWGNVAKHHYSKDQPWNSDESLIHLVRNTEGGSPDSLFLDGQTYEVLFARSVPGDNRWHPTDPDLKIYVAGNRLGYFNVRTGSDTVIRRFTEYSRVDMGPYEGNLSLDGRTVVLYGDNSEVFAYSLSENKKYPTKVASGIDWASISPLGNYVVIMYTDTDTQVFDLNMNFISRFTVNHNHYDMGIDENGDEVAVGISKSYAYDGLIIKHRLSDAAFTKLTTGGYGIHTSTRNNLLPGWSYSSFVSVRNRYRDEVTAVKMDGSETVRRFCHMHNKDTDYLAEAMPVPSHDGKRVIFSSNWNGADARPVGAYVVDARAPCNSLANFLYPPSNLYIETH